MVCLPASSDTLEYSKLVQHIFVWHVEIYIQYNRLVYEINKDTKFAMHMFQGVTSYTNVSSIRSGYNQLDDWQPRPKLKLSLFPLSPTDPLKSRRVKKNDCQK
jgi:hypothetical protein